MYQEVHCGQDMNRWLCQEPGCTAILNDTTLTQLSGNGKRWNTITASNVYQFPESRSFK